MGRVSQRPEATALEGTDILYVIQGGVGKRITADVFREGVLDQFNLNPYAPFSIEETFTQDDVLDNYQGGVFSLITFAPTVNADAWVASGEFATVLTGANNAGSIVGSTSTARHAGSGTVLAVLVGEEAWAQVQGDNGNATLAIGQECLVRNQGNGTITAAKAVQARVLNESGGAITTAYGVFIGEVQGTTRWGLYQEDPGARNYMAGSLVQKLAASVTPSNNGELMVQATSNTSLTFKYKGSDGTVRSVSLTLA